MITRMIVLLLWGGVGYLALLLGNHFGNTPYFFRELFYYKIASIPILKISHIFIELNFYRFLMAFLSTMILCGLSFFSIPRIISFLVCYNYTALISIYHFYFTDKWDSLATGSTEYLLVASIPVFCSISVLIALLGCYTGTKLRIHIALVREPNRCVPGK